jgi:hypothetical protein
VPLTDIDAIAQHLLELSRYRDEPIRSRVAIDAVRQTTDLLALSSPSHVDATIEN